MHSTGPTESTTQSAIDPALISELQVAPFRLMNNLREDINALARKHINNRQEVKSQSIRRCLYDLLFKTRLNDTEFDNLDRITENSQKKYFYFCELLWTTYDSLNQMSNKTAEEKKLAEEIHAILIQHNIKKQYQLLNQISVKEPEEYINAMFDLWNSLNQPHIPDTIYCAGIGLIEEIEKHKNASPRDTRYCATILKETNHLINSPSGTMPDFTRYSTLASNAPGNPSRWRQVIGGMLCVVSALALLALSIAGCLATGGIIAPLIASCLASSLIPFGLFASLIAGARLLASGNRSGISRAMSAYSDSVITHSQATPGFFKPSLQIVPCNRDQSLDSKTEATRISKLAAK